MSDLNVLSILSNLLTKISNTKCKEESSDLQRDPMSGSELVVLEEENDVLVSDERLASHLKILENGVFAEPDLQVLDLDRTGLYVNFFFGSIE